VLITFGTVCNLVFFLIQLNIDIVREDLPLVYSEEEGEELIK
jgi:hypothetical protein